MGGGLLQLVAYGAQGAYITGNPHITFWIVLYKRHTNFAMESIEVTFNGQADFNKRVTAVINRNADLMYRTYVQVVLPGVDLGSGNSTNLRRFRWLNYIGHRLIKVVELEIGGQRIDRQHHRLAGAAARADRPARRTRAAPASAAVVPASPLAERAV